jgi:23S rRNA pseudouridine2605 synthase
VLAAAGVASRRGAEEWIRAGRVTVNGRTAELGESADPARDVVCVDGERLEAEALEYWLVNKPLGVLSTVRDPEGRASILELVPQRQGRLFPVGRLDRDTEGLVLLTNDGPLSHAMLHPSHEVEREYVVRVRGRMRESALQRLASGVDLEDGRTAPAGVDRVTWGDDETLLHLTLIEGRKRQIRRALQALGHPVRMLRRVRMGTLRLGRLAAGEARPLAPREISALLRTTGLAGSRARSSGSKRPRRRRKAQASSRSRK